MKYCKNCGTKIDNDALFCPSCGTPVAKTKKSEKANTSEKSEPVNTGGTMINVNRVYGKTDIEKLPEGYEIDKRYKVIEKLGQGSFGAVYRVFDKDLETEKALKIIPEAVINDKEAMLSLRKEAAIMVKLNHKNIVRVYDFHHTGDIKYIDMEYVQGENLADIKLKRPDRKFTEEEVKDYAVQTTEALAYAHNKKVIHKDIKPQNIMLDNSGEIKIMDFGIAETVHSSMSRFKNTGSSGTLVYMSPEQLRGKNVGKEADIYSLGATLYELLSGNPPFHQGDITYQIINEQATDLINVSKNINAIIQKCLAKDKTKRFSNCEELRKAFLDDKTIENEIKEEERITEKEIIKPQQTYEQTQDKTTTIHKKRKSHVGLIIFLFLFLLALTISGIVYNNNKREQEIIKQQEIEQQQLEQEQKDKEEALWKEALTKNTLLLYDKYISLYNTGKYIEEAKKAIRNSIGYYLKFTIGREEGTIKLHGIRINFDNTEVICSADGRGTLHGPSTNYAFFIRDKNTNKKYDLIGASVKFGVTISKNSMMHIYFEKIPLQTKNIDIIEGELPHSNCWSMHDINLQIPKQQKQEEQRILEEQRKLVEKQKREKQQKQERQKNQKLQVQIELLKQFSYYSDALKNRLSDYEPKKVLLYENFSNYNNGWSKVDDSDGVQSIQSDNRLHIKGINSHQSFWDYVYKAYNDIILSCNVKFVRGNRKRLGGVCIINNNNTRFYFLISGFNTDNKYTFGYYKKGEWTDKGLYTLSDAIIPNSINHLEMIVIHDTIYYFINGQFIKSFTYDENLAGSKIGFFVTGPGDEYSFDDLRVIAIAK